MVAATGAGWRTAPSHITAADLIAGQREDRRRLDPGVHDPALGDAAADDLVAEDPVSGGRAWRAAVEREVSVAVVWSIAPPVRRVSEIPAGRRLTLSHGECLDRDGDLTTAHLDVDLPVLPERLPLGAACPTS